jgi:predicted NBD/HSP70 family sugar kinase
MRHVEKVQERDKAVILDLIRRYGPLSRVEIHELTRLRRATISLLTRALIHEGRIQEAGLSNNPTGRKQVLLEINPNAGMIIAADFDAEMVMAAVLDCRPVIRGRIVSDRTNVDEGVDGLLRQLFSIVRRAAAEQGLDISRVMGIGVGDPGVVDTRGGLSVISSTIGFWKDVPLREMFEREFGVPCVVDNNTRTKTLAERRLGAGERTEDMIFLEYGWGIGAGIVSGGRTIRGARWAAGEFGHTHITKNGPPCSCGSFGCLEAIAGVAALEASLKDAVRQGGFSTCLSMAGGQVEKITGWQVLEAARQGDKMATALVEELGASLGLGLANLVNLFNPSLVILDKRLALAGDLVLDQIVRIVRRQALAYSTEALQFRFAALGSEASLLGAGLTLLDRLFEVPALRPPRFMLDRSLELKAGRLAHRRASAKRKAQAVLDQS